MESARRLLTLVVLGVLLAAATNAVSPRGISWNRPLGRGLAAEIPAAGLFPVEVRSLPDLIRRRSVLFVDARDPEEFRTGRLPGAFSLPWRDVDSGAEVKRLPPRDRPLVVYCSNEFCESSLRLGDWLRRRGYPNVAVLVEGYDAWWNQGGAVEQD